MSALSNKEILDKVAQDEQEVLIYLFDAIEDPVTEMLEKEGATEDDIRAVIEDVLVNFWKEVKSQKFVLDVGIEAQLIKETKTLWEQAASKEKNVDNDLYLNPDEKLKKYITANTHLKYVSYNRGTIGVHVPVFFLLCIAAIGVVYKYRPVEIRTIKEFIQVPYKMITSPRSDSSDYQGTYTEEVVSSTEPKSAGLNVKDSAENPDSADQVVVRKDVLINARNIEVLDKSSATSEKSLSSQVAEKLNPQADLPEEELNSEKIYQVEVWRSPINFRGYKMIRNVLVLYGIDEPEVLKLYQLENNIYLGYQQSFYRLEKTDEFLPLNKVKDPALIAVLNK